MATLSMDIINTYLHSYVCLEGDETAFSPDSGPASSHNCSHRGRGVPAGRLSGSTSVSQTFLINTVSTFAIQLDFNVTTITVCFYYEIYKLTMP